MLLYLFLKLLSEKATFIPFLSLLIGEKQRFYDLKNASVQSFKKRILTINYVISFVLKQTIAL